MLEPVGTSQTRFVTPGLAPDPRGVAMGRYGLFLFPSIERVIGFFHGLSEKLSLDDYLASLCLFQVRTPLKSREFVVQLAVNSSHTMDGIAQVSHLMGGLTFTGSSKHFVKFRDSHAPLGYDVISLFSSPNDFDFIFYDSTFV